MKKEEVPQDNEDLLEGKFKVIKYAVDDNGKYGTVGSVGWQPENTVLKQAWEKIHERVEQTVEKIKAGELSPLAYHMEKQIMDPTMLGQYMGLAKRKIKRHLSAKGFQRLDDATLKKYVDVFNISVDELKKTE